MVSLLNENITEDEDVDEITCEMYEEGENVDYDFANSADGNDLN